MYGISGAGGAVYIVSGDGRRVCTPLFFPRGFVIVTIRDMEGSDRSQG